MSLPPTRPLRIVYIALALVFVTVVGGYGIGKDMALRDNARVFATRS